MTDDETFIEKRKRLLGEAAHAFSQEFHEGNPPSKDDESGSAVAYREEADKYDKIAKLDALRKSGALSEAEFQREKNKILGTS